MISHRPEQERGKRTAYGIVHTFVGGTQEQYEATVAVVHPAGGGLPAGQIFRAAGPSAEGWTVVAIHDSKEDWESFRDTVLRPAMMSGVEGGLTTHPTEIAFEVHDQQSA